MNEHKDASEIVDELVRADEYRLNIRELLAYIMCAGGGPARVADHFWKEFGAAKVGGPTRAQMLNNLMRLLAAYGDTQATDGQYSTEDLEAMTKKALEDLDA